ncbi:MAG: hypothetical protein AB8B63_14215 [Granulosicoccus sp.]
MALNDRYSPTTFQRRRVLTGIQMNNAVTRETTTRVRPDALLNGADAVALPVWQAYNAMETTKRRHFERLEVIDAKKKNYNIDPSEADKLLLGFLLKDHDEQVKRFTEASQQLKLNEPDAHKAIFTYIGLINSEAGRLAVTH